MLTKEQLQKYYNVTHYSDIEAIGFEDQINSIKDIHTICSIVDDPDTGEEVVLVFHDRPDLCGQVVLDPYDNKEYTIPERAGELIDGFRMWYQVGQSEKGYLSVHNAFHYDKPVTEKVLPKCVIPKEKWEDTFIYSKIQYFDRPTPKGAKSAHGLQAYALRMGIHKPEITDFTKMDALMLHRILEDCRTQKFTSQYLAKERQMCKDKLGIDFTEAYRMEVDYTITCHKQERYGAKVDLEHINKCVAEWDVRLEELESLIEPMLPPTVKPQGAKITRKEMAIALGYPPQVTDKMVEPTEIVNRGGEQVGVKIKPYYKPVTNWTTDKKSNVYSGFNISSGETPKFSKKKELTDWIKTNHPETKTSEWDIQKEEVVVKELNSHTYKYFEVEPECVDLIGGAFTKVKFEDSKLTQHEIVKGMLIKGGIKFAKEWNFKKDVNGQIERAEFDTVISYPSKASPDNQIHHTVKKGEPLVTSPKFSEDEYEQLETEDGKMVGEYNTTMHRRRFFSNPKDPENKGLLSAVRPDGRIPCGVNNSSTGTLRSSHRVWVNAPGDGALYGKEIRQSIIAPEGRILVSHDKFMSL